MTRMQDLSPNNRNGKSYALLFDDCCIESHWPTLSALLVQITGKGTLVFPVKQILKLHIAAAALGEVRGS